MTHRSHRPSISSLVSFSSPSLIVSRHLVVSTSCLAFDRSSLVSQSTINDRIIVHPSRSRLPLVSLSSSLVSRLPLVSTTMAHPTVNLASLVHSATDRTYQDFLKLMERCRTLGNERRREEIVKWCEDQRHGALQLLALSHWVNSDMKLIKNMEAQVGSVLSGIVRHLVSARREARRETGVLAAARAPPFDVEGALDAMLNGAAGSWPLVVDEILGVPPDARDEHVEDDEETTPRRDFLLKRLLSTFEVSSERDELMRLERDTDTVALTCPEGSYHIRFSLERYSSEMILWRIVNLTVNVRGEEDSESWVKFHHVRVLGSQLEAKFAEKKRLDPEEVRREMRRFCARVGLRVLHVQSAPLERARLVSVSVTGSSSTNEVNTTTSSPKSEEENSDSMVVRFWPSPTTTTYESEIKVALRSSNSFRVDFRDLRDPSNFTPLQQALSSGTLGLDLTRLSFPRLFAAAQREAIERKLSLLRDRLAYFLPIASLTLSLATRNSFATAAPDEARLLLHLTARLSSPVRPIHVAEHPRLVIGVDPTSGNLTLELNETRAARWGIHSATSEITRAQSALARNHDANFELNVIVSIARMADAFECLAAAARYHPPQLLTAAGFSLFPPLEYAGEFTRDVLPAIARAEAELARGSVGDGGGGVFTFAPMEVAEIEGAERCYLVAKYFAAAMDLVYFLVKIAEVKGTDDDDDDDHSSTAVTRRFLKSPFAPVNPLDPSICELRRVLDKQRHSKSEGRDQRQPRGRQQRKRVKTNAVEDVEDDAVAEDTVLVKA